MLEYCENKLARVENSSVATFIFYSFSSRAEILTVFLPNGKKTSQRKEEKKQHGDLEDVFSVRIRRKRAMEAQDVWLTVLLFIPKRKMKLKVQVIHISTHSYPHRKQKHLGWSAYLFVSVECIVEIALKRFLFSGCNRCNSSISNAKAADSLEISSSSITQWHSNSIFK